MILVTLAIGPFLLIPKDYNLLGMSALSQSVMAANIFFWQKVGYFAPQAEDLPLLHTWSLAVEEQFYLIFPILMIFLFSLRLPKKEAMIHGILWIGVVLSCLLAILVIENGKQFAAFYLLPTRAWELLCGAVLVYFPEWKKNSALWVREIMAWTGLGMILYCFFNYSAKTTFPGLAAIPPCLGSMLMIYSMSSEDRLLLKRLLSWKPVVFIGLISYSLYLWHWPILVYANYWLLHPSNVINSLMIPLSIIIAFLSWKFIETPFRKSNFGDQHRFHAYLLAAGSSLCIAGGGYAIFFLKTPPLIESRFIEKYEKATSDFAFEPDAEIEDIKEDDRYTLGIKDDSKKTEVLMIGDSHCRQLYPIFDQLGRDLGFKARALLRNGGVPVLDRNFRTDRFSSERNYEFQDNVIDYIKSEKSIKHIIIAGRWKGYETKNKDLLESSLRKIIDEYNGLNVKVWLIGSIPEYKINTAKLILLNDILGKNVEDAQMTPEVHYLTCTVEDQYRGRTDPHDAKLTFIDPAPAFLNPHSGIYKISLNGDPLYMDSYHINHTAAMKVLYPLFKEKLKLTFHDRSHGDSVEN